MRKKLLTMLSLCLACTAMAQTDPVVMTINGNPVTRSEFEYSYNKNNTAQTIDRKTVDEYVDMFINYKLKVEAAKELGMDTLTSFKNEFKLYRDEQLRPALIDSTDLEAEAHKLYERTRNMVDSTGGVVKASHILIYLQQDASKEEQDSAKQRIDSIYNALKKGADFAKLAKECSGDFGSAENGGELPWIQHGQTLKEFEDVVYSLKKGELSKPFLSPVGYHVVLLNDKRDYFPYDSLRTNILRYVGQKSYRNRLVNARLDSLVKSGAPGTTKESVLVGKQKELEAKDPNLKYLIQEYHDGLLVYNIAKENVWDKALNDVEGQKQYFKKNKKKYKWDKPRFKGIYYCTKDSADIEAVREAVKDLDFEQWGERLKQTFNSDSTLRIKVEKGLFKHGDNEYVDKVVFGLDKNPVADKKFPYRAVCGKLMKKPKTYQDVQGALVSDYQDMLEKQWVDTLRKKYSFSVNKDVLATVNKH